MKKKIKISNIKQNFYMYYTFLFLIIFLLIRSIFWYYGKSFLWTSDGLSQHYPTLIYTKHWLNELFNNISHGNFKFLMWKFELGFGDDVFNVVSFRPLNFLFFFFPESKVEAFLVFRAFISLYLTGISFYQYAKTKSDNKFALLIGTLTYTFNGFSLFFFARHTFFLEMMFYLPLLFLGADRILEKGKSVLFIIIVAVSAISYFYFLYMITVPAVIYVSLWFICNDELDKKFKKLVHDFFLFVLHYLCGVCISAFSLLPQFMRLFSSSRTSADSGISLIHFDFLHYIDFISGLIDTTEIGIYGHIALYGISMISLFALFFIKTKNKKSDIIQLMIYILTFLIPILTMVFSGFAGKTQRWCFVFLFLTSMIVVKVLPELLSDKTNNIKYIYLAVIIYTLVYMVCKLYTKQNIRPSILWLFITMILVSLYHHSSSKKHIYIMILLTIIGESFTKTYELYSVNGQNIISEYVNAGSVYDYGRDNAVTALELIDDNSLYRIDALSKPSERFNQKNYGLRNDIPAISSYYSYMSGDTADFSFDLGNTQQNVSFLILNWDQRTILNELASVKYMATTELNKNRIPYGYNLLSDSDKQYSDGKLGHQYLYINNYALPLMYVYDSYISNRIYSGIYLYEKEQAMLQGIVIDDDSDFSKTDLKFDYEIILNNDQIIGQLKNKYEDDSSIEINDNSFIIKNANTSMELDVDSSYIGEIYFAISDIEYSSSDNIEDTEKLLSRYETAVLKNKNRASQSHVGTTMSVSMNQITDMGSLYDKSYQYYIGPRDMLYNLGYSNSGNIKITFSTAGKYDFSDIKLICQPMDNYAEQVARLKATPVNDITIAGNNITAKVTTDTDKYVCIAVPYSKGWAAYVNGKKTDIVRANGMYMGIKIHSGDNSIQLVYRTPLLFVGIIISSVTIALMLLILIIKKTIKKRSKKNVQKL
ncbi:MAG: YfhO family protein [Lachnospiraceae bacterium]|nr:YfhO family protein [Lachnospiraceae bacterium]